MNEGRTIPTRIEPAPDPTIAKSGLIWLRQGVGLFFARRIELQILQMKIDMSGDCLHCNFELDGAYRKSN
jgi:hypothetical protein